MKKPQPPPAPKPDYKPLKEDAPFKRDAPVVLPPPPDRDKDQINSKSGRY